MTTMTVPFYIQNDCELVINMDYNIIKKRINEWDPVNLLSFSPEDEYDIEIQEIYDLFEAEETKLGLVIYTIFKNYFGASFTKDKKDCFSVAKKILNDIYNAPINEKN